MQWQLQPGYLWGHDWPYLFRLQWPVRRWALWYQWTDCSNVHRALHVGVRLPRGVNQLHRVHLPCGPVLRGGCWFLQPLPRGHLRQYNGPDHRGVYRELQRGLLWLCHRPDHAHV
jgi:hypothetical protein